jgi:hypothetical protein
VLRFYVRRFGDSDIALFAGFLSTIGLIIILTLALTIYGVASFGQEKIRVIK